MMCLALEFLEFWIFSNFGDFWNWEMICLVLEFLEL